MPTRKQDLMVGRRHLWNFLFLGAPFLGAFLVAIYAHQRGRMDWLIAAFVVGFAIALFGLIRQERLFRQYRCPDCGDRLANPPRKPGSGSSICVHVAI